ncbi:Erg28-like protein [Amanita rubescens]|nr:Erg28-like protein [Amanita rubescens]
MLYTLVHYLPQSPGWLPHWQLFIAITALFNTIQNYTTLKLTRRVYNNASVTSLQARTFGTWTLTATIVRAYAAYNINNKPIYDMALLTYLIAFGHFFSEFLIFRTIKFGAGLLGPAIVSTTTLIWMIAQYDFYVKA